MPVDLEGFFHDGIHPIGFAAAGGCDVELFAGRGLRVDEDVGGVHGYALDPVNGGGVAELNVCCRVLGGQGEYSPVPEALPFEVAALVLDDGP